MRTTPSLSPGSSEGSFAQIDASLRGLDQAPGNMFADDTPPSEVAMVFAIFYVAAHAGLDGTRLLMLAFLLTLLPSWVVVLSTALAVGLN